VRVPYPPFIRLPIQFSDKGPICSPSLLLRLARQRFAHDVRGVVHLQSCYRRRLARKELKQLKIEARSTTKLKEISGKLENKVVELTQSLQKRDGDKKKLQARINELEELQQAWTGRHEEAATKVRELQDELQKPTVPRALFEELQQAKASMDARLGDALKAVADKETALAALEAEIGRHTQTLADRQAMLDAATAKAAEDAAAIDGLRTELAGVRESLNRANTLAALSRNAGGGASSNGPISSPNSQALRTLDNGAVDHFNGLNGLPAPPAPAHKAHGRRHSGPQAADSGRQRDSADQLMVDARKAQASQNRAISVAAFAPDAVSHLKDANGLPMVFDSPEEQIMQMLLDAERLDEDVLGGLIRTLKIPVPSLQALPTHKEVVFPAHLIALVSNEMWKYGLIPEAERFLANVMQEIQKHLLVRPTRVTISG
jgi:myosin-5